MRKEDNKDDGLQSFQIDSRKVLTLKVKKPCGSIISFDATSDMTINDLKIKIMEVEKVQTAATQIWHLGKQRLSGKVSLGAYNIVEEDLLALSLRQLDPEEITCQLDNGTFEFKSCEIQKDRGYDKNLFVDIVDITKWNAYCVVCHNVLRDAMEIDCDCGGNICECCLRITRPKTSLDGGVKVPCLTEGCTKTIDLNGIGKTRALRRVILKQKVRCNSNMASESEKCSWTGPLADLEKHIEVCGFRSVVCPLNCNRTNLTKGVMTMEGHFAECPGFFFKCPHCIEFFTRSELIQHEGCCPEELVNCIYDCGNKHTRRESERHNEENMMLHMWCMKKSLNTETKKREVLEKKIIELKKSHKEVLDVEAKRRDLLEKEVVGLKTAHKEALVELDVQMQKCKVLEVDISKLKVSVADNSKNIERLMRWSKKPMEEFWVHQRCYYRPCPVP